MVLAKLHVGQEHSIHLVFHLRINHVVLLVDARLRGRSLPGSVSLRQVPHSWRLHRLAFGVEHGDEFSGTLG